MVRGVADPADELLADKNRTDNRDIRQVVAAAVIRVVDDEHIAGVDILGLIFRDHAAGSEQKRGQKHGDAGLHLDNDVSRGVHDGGCIVAPLLDIGGVCALDNNGVRFLCNRHQKVANHFNGNRIRFSVHDLIPPS